MKRSEKKAKLLKLSQNATNEIWSSIMRGTFPTPGAKKRAIEHAIRGAMEELTNLPSTVDGSESGYNYMNGKCSKILPNPNGDKAAIRALVKALSSSTMILSGQELNKAMLTQALRDAKKALEHPDVKPILSDLKQEDLFNG